MGRKKTVEKCPPCGILDNQEIYTILDVLTERQAELDEETALIKEDYERGEKTHDDMIMVENMLRPYYRVKKNISDAVSALRSCVEKHEECYGYGHVEPCGFDIAKAKRRAAELGKGRSYFDIE